MIQALILTCLSSLPIEQCSPDVALDVRVARAALPMQCAMAGLTAAAQDPRGGAGVVTKIICGRAGGGR